VGSIESKDEWLVADLGGSESDSESGELEHLIIALEVPDSDSERLGCLGGGLWWDRSWSSN
jgi:hypothetical protein